MLLLAKDGHYMMKIPRLVNHIFLAPGNRWVGNLRVLSSSHAKYPSHWFLCHKMHSVCITLI